MRPFLCRIAAVMVAVCASIAATWAGAANNAAFVSQSVPATMALGQTYHVSVTMQNTGDTIWQAAGLYRLGAQAPQDNNRWSLHRVELPNDVPPGATVTFDFVVVAPSAAGTYEFQWRMVQEGVAWFGAFTDNVAVKNGVNGAVFVSQSVPSTMLPGISYPVSVTMQNTGNAPWSADHLYRLGSQNPRDNKTWTYRIALPNAVAPGESVTFSFIVTAPAVANRYDFQWQMVEEGVEWFGEMSPNIAVTVGTNDAEFISQSAPSDMLPGQTYPVSLTMKNVGNTTWTPDLYKLGPQIPRDNTYWGPGPLFRATLNGPVAPGESVTFNFAVTAPSVPGTYNFQWRMLEEGVEQFGAMSQSILVKDGNSDSIFVSQSVPQTMTAGQSYPVTVVMQNTGNTTWTAGALFRLGSQNPQENTVWNVRRVELPADVPPGAQVTFNFNVAAPATPGTYHFAWQMLQEGVTWFGAQTVDLSVSVQAPSDATGLDIKITPVDDGTSSFLEGTSIFLEVYSGLSTVGVASTSMLIDGVPVDGFLSTNDDVEYFWPNLPEGTHSITGRATSVTGQTTSRTVAISVIVDPKDVPIRSVINNLKVALAAGDRAQAMALFSDTGQLAYGPVIDALMPNMPQIVSGWSEPRFIYGDEDSAEYAVTRSYNDIPRIYIFTFVRNANGDWVIDSM